MLDGMRHAIDSARVLRSVACRIQFTAVEHRSGRQTKTTSANQKRCSLNARGEHAQDLPRIALVHAWESNFKTLSPTRKRFADITNSPPLSPPHAHLPVHASPPWQLTPRPLPPPPPTQMPPHSQPQLPPPPFAAPGNHETPAGLIPPNSGPLISVRCHGRSRYIMAFAPPFTLAIPPPTLS